MAWIKNDSGSDKTWVGQLVENNTYYNIQSTEEVSWANDSTLLADIGSGDAIVAKDDSGSNDITDVNDAINYLKGLLPSSVELSKPANLSGVKEANGMRARLIGIINQTVTKNTTTNLDWLCPQLQYNSVDKPSYFDGIEYYAKDAEVGDKATFQVVDKDGFGVTAGWYTQAQFDAMGNLYVVEEFGKDWAMMPNDKHHLSLYKASIIPGLYIRLKYTSTGTTNDIDLVVNLFRHLDGT